MARFLKYLMLCLLLLFFISPVCAKEIQVSLDGKALPCRMAPILENDRVLLPMRDLMEPLGYTVLWNDAEKSLTAKKGNTQLYMKVNSSYATVNDQPVVLDVPVRIIENLAFVPLRFVSEYSGAAVFWKGDTATVEILRDTETPYSISDSVVMLQGSQFSGSGVILSSDGLIATNYHVIEGTSMLQIIFDDGTVYQGKTTVVGLDPQADIALLQIEKTGLSPVKITTALAEGQSVVTVSSPQGNRNIQTSGTLSHYNQDILSFTAPLNFGSSGGGVFNAQGKWLGLCSSMSEDLYFAIPAQKVLAVPRNMSLPISEMKNYVYTPSAPRNVRITTSGTTVQVSWEPVFGADDYRVYLSSSADGPFTKMSNPTKGGDRWLWGFPYAFSMTYASSEPLYCRIETMENGVSRGMSQAVRLF
ncbi:trypsin-like peptidase domain-containing protein [Anaerotignum lactatifermentans]|uniref:Trypsin-like peptidase domain-containing protein n=1 Tax=Anaerotignum lactatifermentans TaxID=160404 RepID=A0ABS2GAZ5_9FIRM|nr:stalk domain-containing protein [Anaerotignum lactatifermentans]MBM6829840.1 trypsin-like peptidase domain-containing protein [Anaerotignum lactatifermentans]MBM6878220.1 trypsin-like peptidase domain-containing protein [Anaerotignum lactatifermentans]MBM6951300.1 trypsin-like peptidase domain-containing protein [Anaerotignum lactatifermentans]